MDTLTQKFINKFLNILQHDCMGQMLLGQLNYGFSQELNIRYAPDELGSQVNGRYNKPSHTITLRSATLTTLSSMPIRGTIPVKATP